MWTPTPLRLYAKNMGQLMMEKITNADLLVFNRCTDELKDALRKRNLRMVNRRADIYLEDWRTATARTTTTATMCPFDLDQEVIDIPDDDLRRVVCGCDGPPGPLGGEDWST